MAIQRSSVYEVLRENAWEILLVFCFLIGQYYLIEYRVTEVERQLLEITKTSNATLNRLETDVTRNRRTIQEIQVLRASDMGEIKTLLSGLQKQIERLENLGERQTKQIERMFNNKELQKN